MRQRVAGWRITVYLLYDLTLLLSAFFLVPYYLLRGLRDGKSRRGIRERLGFYAPGRLACLEGRRVIWIHAVSVGETRAAIPLVKALRKAYPDDALVLSNVTETGRSIASGIKELDLYLFFPFDLSFVVQRVLRKVAPSLVIIVETEIWPNFVRTAHARNVPVVLVNGRISDRSFPRYLKGRALLRPVLEKFSAFCMQTELDAERISAMGAPAKRIEVTGNLKFDLQSRLPAADEVVRLKARFRLSPEETLWVAGSTHAGEEEIVIDNYRHLIEAGRAMILILVPRHPERCRAVGEMLAARGVPFALRSEVESREAELKAGEVLLVDTVGEMLNFYTMADLVFVGGSFADIGGHNILEASMLKKPVIFGPHMHNFKEISRLIRTCGGGTQVSQAEELLPAVSRLLDNDDARTAMGEAGYALLSRNAGATAKSLAAIDRVFH